MEFLSMFLIILPALVLLHLNIGGPVCGTYSRALPTESVTENRIHRLPKWDQVQPKSVEVNGVGYYP